MYKINALINSNDINKLKLIDNKLIVLDSIDNRTAVSFKIAFNGCRNTLLKHLSELYNNFKYYAITTL